MYFHGTMYSLNLLNTYMFPRVLKCRNYYFDDKYISANAGTKLSLQQACLTGLFSSVHFRKLK